MTPRDAFRSEHLPFYEAIDLQTSPSDRYLATFDLDSSGVLLGFNAAGQQMLMRQNLLLGSLREKLDGASPDLSVQLNAALSERAGNVVIISLSDTTGVRHALLIAPETNSGSYAAPCRIRLVVRDLLAWAESHMRIPARVYLLTASETALAHSLVMGRSLTTHARLRGSVVATVRKQLSAIFSKTGTSRQVELVATLLATAALIDPWSGAATENFAAARPANRTIARRPATRTAH